MTTEQQIEVHTAIAERFPNGVIPVPTVQTLNTTRGNLGRDLGLIPEDARLVGSSIVGETVIVKWYSL